MDQGGLTGAVVAHKSHAFASCNEQIHAVQGTNGAEMPFDAVQFNDIHA
jgi:hypothetical protein